MNRIGNKNKDTNFSLQCILCGAEEKVSLVAHRNEKNYITGFVVACEYCQKQLNEFYAYRYEVKEADHENPN